jgi:hypothetical protein
MTLHHKSVPHHHLDSMGEKRVLRAALLDLLEVSGDVLKSSLIDCGTKAKIESVIDKHKLGRYLK